MSGLFNSIFGQNPDSKQLLKMLQLDQTEAPLGKDILYKSYKGEDGVEEKYICPYFEYDDERDENELSKAIDEWILECTKKGYYPTGRFRDIYVSEDDKICLYTRNGGGNRESYQYVFDILRKHPNYICDYDDDFDCTYATIEFSIPDEVKNIVEKMDKNISGEERWNRFFKGLNAQVGKEE